MSQLTVLRYCPPERLTVSLLLLGRPLNTTSLVQNSLPLGVLAGKNNSQQQCQDKSHADKADDRAVAQIVPRPVPPAVDEGRDDTAGVTDRNDAENEPWAV